MNTLPSVVIAGTIFLSACVIHDSATESTYPKHWAKPMPESSKECLPFETTVNYFGEPAGDWNSSRITFDGAIFNQIPVRGYPQRVKASYDGKHRFQFTIFGMDLSKQMERIEGELSEIHSNERVACRDGWVAIEENRSQVSDGVPSTHRSVTRIAMTLSGDVVVQSQGNAKISTLFVLQNEYTWNTWIRFKAWRNKTSE